MMKDRLDREAVLAYPFDQTLANGVMMEKLSLSPRSFRRQAIQAVEDDLVRIGPLEEGAAIPLAITPTMNGIDLAGWIAGNRDLLLAKLSEYGAVLFRNFGINDSGTFREVTVAVSDQVLDYRERSSPRSEVGKNVYTSTDYPADQPIFLHNENSYQNTWPMKLFFYCHKRAASGGETPIADVRRVYRRIDPEIRRRFAERKWMYVRNFGGFGLPWEEVFQSTERSQVEEYCRRNGIQFEWNENGLRTRAVRPAVARHPGTGEMVWFNHATFFHVSTLPRVLREVLTEELAEEDLPSNSYYGDGSPIEEDVLDHLRAVYQAETVIFPWQEGDVLLVDNMMVAHARAPFTGERKVLVTMAEPCRWEDLPPPDPVEI